MKLEDYFKYYIQGSDHYLIPKYVFKELFDEMSNWRDESKQLKDNWNKLYQYILGKYNRDYEKVYIDDILDTMQRIEGSESDD